MFFAAAGAFAMLRAWRDWTASAPDTITTTYRILCLPPLPEVPEPLRGVPTVCVDVGALDPAGARGLESRLRYVASPILAGLDRCQARRSPAYTETPRIRCRRSAMGCC